MTAMVWKQNPSYPERDPFVDYVLGIVHKRIDEVIRQHPERGLIDCLARMHWKSWWGVKLVSGTSAQWPWLAEYCVFYVVKNHIEKALEIEFKPVRTTKYLWHFVERKQEPRYTLAHNCFLEKGLQPDVTLHKDSDLIFTMDVKVGVRSSDALNRALDKLTYTVDNYNSQGYLVCVTKHLTFSVDNVSNHFMKFSSAGCEVAGPKGGTLESKMEEMGYSLLRLEECLDKICSVL
jgi:hypothetical protein